MSDWKMQKPFIVSEKGTGWTVSLANRGAYIECFLWDGLRLLEFNFFDGNGRDVEWTACARHAFSVAFRWQCGRIMEEAVIDWMRSDGKCA